MEFFQVCLLFSMNYRQNGIIDQTPKPNMASALYPIRPNVIISFEALSFYVFWRIKEKCTFNYRQIAHADWWKRTIDTCYG